MRTPPIQYNVASKTRSSPIPEYLSVTVALLLRTYYRVNLTRQDNCFFNYQTEDSFLSIMLIMCFKKIFLLVLYFLPRNVSSIIWFCLSKKVSAHGKKVNLAQGNISWQEVVIKWISTESLKIISKCILQCMQTKWKRIPTGNYTCLGDKMNTFGRQVTDLLCWY